MDPPYGEGLAQAGARPNRGRPWVDSGGWISVEKGPEPLILPEGIELDAERRFGKAHLLLLRRTAAPAGE